MGRPRKIFTKYPRRRNKGEEALFALFLVGILISVVISAAQAIWSSTAGRVSIFAIVGFIIISAIAKIARSAQLQADEEQRRDRLTKAIAEVQISTNRQDYLIDGNDYRRGNAKENLYRKTFLLPLLEVFGNQCAKCGSKDNGIDLDHFFMSKNEGGNFIMRHTSGHLVNNAIPLCQSCNRSKSDRHYSDFFSQEELLELFKKNALMTQTVNDSGVIQPDGTVVKQRARRARA